MHDNSIGACRRCGAKIPPAYYQTSCKECGELLPLEVLRVLPAAANVTPEILRLAGGPVPEVAGSERAHAPDAVTTPLNEDPPLLTTVFRGLAGLEMIGGLLACAALWPGTPELGYTWKTVAYIPALTWLVAGFIFGFLFLALGEALLYLRDIRSRLRLLTLTADALVVPQQPHSVRPPDQP
jgi:hypothetical protein